MLNERELQVYNAIKEHDDGRGVNHIICQMYGIMEEDEFNRIADSLVAKGKLKKFENAFGRTLYSVKDELEDKISSGRGNFFSSFERKFAAADKQTIMNTAHDGMIDFIQTSGMTNVKIILNIFFAAARIGLCGKHKLSAPQKEMLRDILTDIFKYSGDMEFVYANSGEGYSEDDFAMIEQFCNTALRIHATEPALHLLAVILSFAYIDGKLDDAVGARLESIYGMILMGNFFEQGETEEPDNTEESESEQHKRAEEEKARKLAEQRKAEEKRQAEERKKREEAARRAEEEKKQKIQQAHDAWKAKCKAIEQRRSEELQKILQAERSTMMAVAQSNKQKAIDAANEIIESENRRLREAEATLASLGLFSFSQKKQQKSIIEDARSQIDSAQRAITRAQSDYITEEGAIGRKLDSKQADLQVKLEKQYPLPPEPERPFNASSESKSHMTLQQQQNMTIKDEIYICLLAGAATATEVLNMIQHKYPDMTNQRTASYLRQLILDGRVKKTDVNGKAYFTAEV